MDADSRPLLLEKRQVVALYDLILLLFSISLISSHRKVITLGVSLKTGIKHIPDSKHAQRKTKAKMQEVRSILVYMNPNAWHNVPVASILKCLCFGN